MAQGNSLRGVLGGLAFVVMVLGCVEGKSVTPSHCGGTDIFQISSITQTPDKPRFGGSATFTVEGTTPVQVDGGQLHVVARPAAAKWIPIKDERRDLCGQLAAGHSCPVVPGPAVIEYTMKIPKPSFVSWFSQTFNVQVTATDPQGGQLSCLSFKVKVYPHSSSLVAVV